MTAVSKQFQMSTTTKVLHFGCHNLGSRFALDQYRTLIGNRIRRIEWSYICGRLIRLPEVPEIAFGTHRICPSVSRPTSRMSCYLSI